MSLWYLRPFMNLAKEACIPLSRNTIRLLHKNFGGDCTTNIRNFFSNEENGRILRTILESGMLFYSESKKLIVMIVVQILIIEHSLIYFPRRQEAKVEEDSSFVMYGRLQKLFFWCHNKDCVT